FIKFIVVEKRGNMQNIIVFLQIISFFMIIILLISKEKRKNLKLLIPLFLFMIVSVWFYHIPRHLKDFNDLKYTKEIYGTSIDLHNLDHVNRYKLFDEDHDELMILMKDIKYTPSEINSYSIEDDVKVFLLCNKPGGVIYTIVFNLNDSKSAIMSSNSKGLDYYFDINDKLRDYIEKTNDKYYDAVLDYDRQPNMKYTFYEEEDGDTITWKYNFDKDNAYILTDIYLYIDKKGGGRGWSSKVLERDEAGYHIEFSLSADYIHENIISGGMKLQLRGMYNNLPFQKEILVY
ncbi:hypothetical protein QUF55_08885, partial [Clostridiaceae bacterium HSG29]|nr:hypothetical protein [Clostridiaceae bacterium HSG29]